MKIGIYRACGGATLAMLAAMPVARAQTPPYNIGSAVRESEESRHPGLPRVHTPLVLPGLAEPQFKMGGNETLFVRTFKLDGPILADQAEIGAILGPYENRKLTLSEIYAAADGLTTLYRNKGYLLAKVYVPAQNARGGVLHIKILPGRYGAITINNASLVRDDFLHEVVDHALAGSPLIHQAELERAMLLVSDLPGAGMPRVAVGAGRQPETSDFAFNVPEGRRFDGYVLGDNFGSPYTGRDRVSAGLNVNSPLGYGDRLSGFGIISEHTHLVNGRIGYAFPLGYDGLRGEVAAFRTTYALGGVYNTLDATGTANAVMGTLTYPIRRTRDDSIYVSANFTHKMLNDKVLGTSIADRTIDLGTAAISRDTVGTVPFTELPMTTNTAFSVTSGYVNFPDPLQKAANVAGVDTAGNYTRLNLSFTATVALAERWSISTYLRAQKSLTGNLDSSEQMSLSGFWGVRSYDEGLSGDSGYIVTPELKYALPDIYAYRHSVGLFTDVGAGWLENGAYTITQKSYTPLNDVGLGYYATYEYSPVRFLVLKALVAHSYGTDNSVVARTYDQRTKGLVQVGLTF